MSDDTLDLRRDYFCALRREISATQTRIFVLLVLGLVGSPLLTYFAVTSDHRMLNLVAPFAVLLLLVFYQSEQIAMMRLGSYIRQKIESKEADWEHWVGGLNLRSTDQHFFAMFIVIGLFFYTILSVIFVRNLLAMDYYEVSVFDYYFWKYGTLGFFVLATLWALSTMIRFWHSATHTSQ